MPEWVLHEVRDAFSFLWGRDRKKSLTAGCEEGGLKFVDVGVKRKE